MQLHLLTGMHFYANESSIGRSQNVKSGRNAEQIPGLVPEIKDFPETLRAYCYLSGRSYDAKFTVPTVQQQGTNDMPGPAYALHSSCARSTSSQTLRCAPSGSHSHQARKPPQTVDQLQEQCSQGQGSAYIHQSFSVRRLRYLRRSAGHCNLVSRLLASQGYFCHK